MKKLRRILFYLMLSCQMAAGLFPVFRMHLNAKPPIYVQEENPCKNSREAD